MLSRSHRVHTSSSSWHVPGLRRCSFQVVWRRGSLVLGVLVADTLLGGLWLWHSVCDAMPPQRYPYRISPQKYRIFPQMTELFRKLYWNTLENSKSLLVRRFKRWTATYPILETFLFFITTRILAAFELRKAAKKWLTRFVRKIKKVSVSGIGSSQCGRWGGWFGGATVSQKLWLNNFYKVILVL